MDDAASVAMGEVSLAATTSMLCHDGSWAGDARRVDARAMWIGQDTPRERCPVPSVSFAQ